MITEIGSTSEADWTRATGAKLKTLEEAMDHEKLGKARIEKISKVVLKVRASIYLRLDRN